MANVTVDFQGQNIHITKVGAPPVTMSITNLRSLLDPTRQWTDDVQFKYEQEYINYLDTIKDGKIVTSKISSLEQGRLLGQITVTPDPNKANNAMYGNLAAAAQGALPVYPDLLNNLEDRVVTYAETLGLIEKSSGLPNSTVKASLASKLAIDSVFHDAGRGPETYCKPGQYKMVNSIAQYIDPATDMHFDEVYPVHGSRIHFTPSFMHLFGLGGPPGFESEVVATATNLKNFDYRIKCYGDDISHNGVGLDPNMASPPREGVFIGNPEKNRVIMDRTAPHNVDGAALNIVAEGLAADPVNFAHCRKLLACKEWGDKMQVLNVLVYKMLEPGKRYVLLTNDKVVFTLAISLGVQTIWSGVENHTKIIKHFNPPTAPGELLKGIKLSFTQRKKQIITNNKLVIKNLIWLSNHLGADLERQGGSGETDWHFSKEFYIKIAEDFTIINEFLKVLKLSRALETYAGVRGPQEQDGIERIRKLKGYLEYFSFKDIITQKSKRGGRKFATNSDRYTNVLLPIWTTAAATAGDGAAAIAADQTTPKQHPLPPRAPVGALQATNVTQEFENQVQQIYNLRELVTLMLDSGAAFGNIVRNGVFDGGTDISIANNAKDIFNGVVLQGGAVPHQVISFFFAARPFDLVGGTPGAPPPHAWRGSLIPASYQAAAAAAAAAGAPIAIVGGGKEPKTAANMSMHRIEPYQLKRTHSAPPDLTPPRHSAPPDLTPPPLSRSPSLGPDNSSAVGSLDMGSPPLPPASPASPVKPRARAPNQGTAPDVVQKLNDLYKPLDARELHEIAALFEPTELNTEPFTVTDINKENDQYITIDINKRLRDIITLKTFLPESDSMHQEICKEFLETSEKLYIHEFDEETDERGRMTFDTIKAFNTAIDVIINKYYPDLKIFPYQAVLQPLPPAGPEAVKQLLQLAVKLLEQQAALQPAQQSLQIAQAAITAAEANPTEQQLLQISQISQAVTAAAAGDQTAQKFLQQQTQNFLSQQLDNPTVLIIALQQAQAAVKQAAQQLLQTEKVDQSVAAVVVTLTGFSHKAAHTTPYEGPKTRDAQAAQYKLNNYNKLLLEVTEGQEVKAIVNVVNAVLTAAASAEQAEAAVKLLQQLDNPAALAEAQAAQQAALQAAQQAGQDVNAQQAAAHAAYVKQAAAQVAAKAKVDPEDVQQALQAAQVIAQQAAAQAVAAGGDQAAAAQQAAQQQIQAAALAIVTGADMVAAVNQVVAQQAAQQAAVQAGDGSGSAGGGKKKKQTKRKKKKNTKRKGKRSNIKKTKNKKKRASNGQKKKKKKTKRGRKSKN